MASRCLSWLLLLLLVNIWCCGSKIIFPIETLRMLGIIAIVWIHSIWMMLLLNLIHVLIICISSIVSSAHTLNSTLIIWMINSLMLVIVITWSWWRRGLDTMRLQLMLVVTIAGWHRMLRIHSSVLKGSLIIHSMHRLYLLIRINWRWGRSILRISICRNLEIFAIIWITLILKKIISIRNILIYVSFFIFWFS